jgi:hypothetical protein
MAETVYQRPAISIDQQLPETVERLADRFTRHRLQALARVEGHHRDGKPVVLFLYTHNAGRSQMALGSLTHLAADQAVAWSGGSEPDIAINPSAVAAMAERGIDITGEYPKPWTDEVVRVEQILPIRDDLERRVRHLLDEIGMAAR